MKTGLTQPNTPRNFTFTVKFDGDIFNDTKALAVALRDVAREVEDAPFSAGVLGYVIYDGSRVGSWGFQNGINDN